MIVTELPTGSNDEEFALRDGPFRWSPDGQYIALLAVRPAWRFRSIASQLHRGLYPAIFRYPYPKPGQTNSAVRIGVVSAKGRLDPMDQSRRPIRATSISRGMEWSANRELILETPESIAEHQRRPAWPASATGEVRRMFRDQDAGLGRKSTTNCAGVDGGRLLWTKREGTAGAASTPCRATGTMRLITTPPVTSISIAGVDPAGGWLYYIASRKSLLAAICNRTRLDGSGKAERITRPGLSGLARL